MYSIGLGLFELDIMEAESLYELPLNNFKGTI